MSRPSRGRKTEVVTAGGGVRRRGAWTRALDGGERYGVLLQRSEEGREMPENRPVPSAVIDFARMQLHMQSLRVHTSLLRPSRFAGPARASAPQLIKPARNLYRHYTLFCVQKALTA